MTVRIYAIGDIHGQLGQLQALHRAIAADRKAHGVAEDVPVVHLGDLVDRGPDSAGVIDFILEGRARGAPWIVLAGNHDAVLSGFLESGRIDDPHLPPGMTLLHPNMGGVATLASYGIDAREGDDPAALHARALASIPESHRAFLRELPRMHRRGPALFVHAGIRPGVPLDRQDPDDLVWIRHAFLDDPRDHGVLVVHGHTSVKAATHAGNRVNIDTGAGWGRQATAILLEGTRVFVVEGDGQRRALRPHAGA